MTEKVNPDIIGYIQKVEMRLQEQLHMIGEPYEAMVTDALERFQEVLLQMGIDAAPVKRDLQSFGDLNAREAGGRYRIAAGRGHHAIQCLHQDRGHHEAWLLLRGAFDSKGC